MNTRWKSPNRWAGEVSLRFLIVGAVICVGLYFFIRPKPAPLVVEAASAPATPPPATPARAPVLVKAAAALPPVVVEAVPPVATPPPLDLGTVARTPALWPKQVALLQPVVFPIMFNARPSGSVTVPAGAALRLRRVVGQQVDVEYQNARQLIPATATDLMPRALAAYRAANPAAVAVASAEPPAPVVPADGTPTATAPAPNKVTPPAGGKIPELRVQAVVGTSQKRSGTSSYIKEQIIKPKCLIVGASQMSAIPALEATMLIVTMGTMAKYVAGDEAYFVQTTETLPVEPAANGASRTFLFGESTVRFDSWRDPTNLGGRVYKYFVFGLTDTATRELIDFQTNCPELATHCKARPDKRAGFLKLAAGAKFPAKFN